MVDTLSIDFGTSYTAAAVSTDGAVTTVAFSDGATRMPSSVFLDQKTNRLLVGALADNQAALDPNAYEATPKRWVGHGKLSLAGVEVLDVDCVAAVLTEVADEVRHQCNGGVPERILLTHPAAWRTRKLDVLCEAARRAGLADPELVAEPCAAAAYFAQGDQHLEPGQALCIYDLGGGTFDVAVVQRTPDSFQIVGPPEGVDPLGGETFDHRLLEHVEHHVRTRDEAAWAALRAASDERWARNRRNLRIEVRRAKEALSRVRSHQLFIPGLDESFLITRDELERLIQADVDRTIDKTLSATQQAGHPTESLSGIYLAGGASRSPLVGQRIYERTDISPRTFDDPKLIVCKGALADAAPTQRSSSRPSRTRTPGPETQQQTPVAEPSPEPTAPSRPEPPKGDKSEATTTLKVSLWSNKQSAQSLAQLDRWLVDVGATVSAGSPVAVASSQTGLLTICAARQGTVTRLLLAPGIRFGPGRQLLEVKPPGAGRTWKGAGLLAVLAAVVLLSVVVVIGSRASTGVVQASTYTSSATPAQLMTGNPGCTSTSNIFPDSGMTGVSCLKGDYYVDLYKTSLTSEGAVNQALRNTYPNLTGSGNPGPTQQAGGISSCSDTYRVDYTDSNNARIGTIIYVSRNKPFIAMTYFNLQNQNYDGMQTTPFPISDVAAFCGAQ